MGMSFLAVAYYQLGQFEQASAEAGESLRLLPNFAHAHWYLALALLRLNRLAEAAHVIGRALRLNLDTPDFHTLQYQLAFIESDSTGMQEQLDWAETRQ